MAEWNFKEQIVCITGASGGLGHDLIQSFLESGGKVYASGRENNKLEELKNDFGNDSNFMASTVDVTRKSEVNRWIQNLYDREGKIDVLINGAGICPLCSIEDMSEELWDEIVDVNLKGTFLVSQSVMNFMKEQGSGRIINISSIGAYTGGAIAPVAYSAAKGGVVSMTKSFATGLSPKGITVNCVSPGPFETAMIADFPAETMEKISQATPTRRIGKTADVVHAILFLADDMSSHITGATIDVNGGLYMR